jgi:hypothetical protein
MKTKNKRSEEKDLAPMVVEETLTHNHHEPRKDPPTINGYSVNFGCGLSEAFTTLQHIAMCPECKSRWQNILKCAQTFKDCQEP